MEKEKYYKLMFLIGSLWNIMGGVLLFVLSFTIPSVFTIAATPTPPTLLFYHAMVGMIITYGIGYFIVSRNITKNHGIIVIGSIAKLIFFLATVVFFFMGDVNFNIVTIGLGDLFFVILFVEFLINKKKT